jgi:propanediol dehydratase small subunit
VEPDLRPERDALRRQSELARGAGRAQLAENFERAAELAGVPSEVILDVYTALRPHRSSGEELADWAATLEREYEAHRCAAYVREARAVYAERGLLRERVRL